MPQPHSALFAGKQITAGSDVVIFNEETGVTTSVAGEKQALKLFLQLSQQPRVHLNKLHILRWFEAHWIELDPGSMGIDRLVP
jgi:hypothetical protein